MSLNCCVLLLGFVNIRIGGIIPPKTTHGNGFVCNTKPTKHYYVIWNSGYRK